MEPLTPDECSRLAAPNDIELEPLIERINAALVDAEKTGRTLTLNYETWFPTPRIYCEIQRKYYAAGWDVHKTHDQRDGDYITIKKREVWDPR